MKETPAHKLCLTTPTVRSTLPFRLGRERLADPWCDPDGSHEVGKEGVPARDFALHFQQHTLHAVGQRGFGQPAKVLKGLHQTADHASGASQRLTKVTKRMRE